MCNIRCSSHHCFFSTGIPPTGLCGLYYGLTPLDCTTKNLALSSWFIQYIVNTMSKMISLRRYLWPSYACSEVTELSLPQKCLLSLCCVFWMPPKRYSNALIWGVPSVFRSIFSGRMVSCESLENIPSPYQVFLALISYAHFLFWNKKAPCQSACFGVSLHATENLSREYLLSFMQFLSGERLSEVLWFQGNCTAVQRSAILVSCWREWTWEVVTLEMPSSQTVHNNAVNCVLREMVGVVSCSV